MSHLPVRLIALSAAAAVALIVPAGAASATPACRDAVAKTLHTAHDTTGDPAGILHKVEETYCSVS